MIDAALRELMQDEVTIAHFASQDVNGQETGGTPVTYTCRVVGQRKRIRMANGEEATSMAQIYLDRIVSIDPRSILTLPARFVPQQPVILAVASFPDEGGLEGSMAHTVVFC